VGEVKLLLSDLTDATGQCLTADILSIAKREKGKMDITLEKEADCCRRTFADPRGCRDMAGYTFESYGSEKIRVHEHISESPYSFVVPVQLLQILSQHRQRKEAALRKEYKASLQVSKPVGEGDTFGNVVEVMRLVQEKSTILRWYRGNIEKVQAHLRSMLASIDYLTDNYVKQNLYFKPSTHKTDSTLAFVPTNLHVQELKVLRPANGATEYRFVTVGAPAAHVYKFRCGLRQLLHNKHRRIRRLNKDFDRLQRGKGGKEDADLKRTVVQLQREITEMDIEIQQRTDVVLCQAVPSLITSFSEEFEQRGGDSSWVRQLLDIGYLIHFESLLSTHGSEIGMLGDMDVAVKLLGRVMFRLERESSTLRAGQVVVEEKEDDQLGQPGQSRHSGMGAPNADPLEEFIETLFGPQPAEEEDANSAASSNSTVSATSRPASHEGFPGGPHATPVHPFLEEERSDGDFSDEGYHAMYSPRVEQRVRASRPAPGEEGRVEESKPLRSTGGDMVDGLSEGESTSRLGSGKDPDRRSRAGWHFVRNLGLAGDQEREPDVEAKSLEKLAKRLRRLKADLMKRGGGNESIIWDTLGTSQFVVRLGCRRSVYDALPDAAKRGQYIRVRPVLFSQGINEQQTVANATGECVLQEEINKENMFLLGSYFRDYRNHVRLYWEKEENTIEERIGNMDRRMTMICKTILTSKAEKNTIILPATADFSNEMHAGRVTCCKSAKDRTSMSITWEQARLLENYHGLQDGSQACEVMRTNGVRRENAYKNIGKNKFAFNAVQRRFLPSVYQPAAHAGGARIS